MIARFQKWALWIGVLAVIAVAAHWALNRYEAKFDAEGFVRADNMHKLQNASDAAARLLAQSEADAEAKAKLDSEAANVLTLSKQLVTANRVIDVQTKKLNERANDVSTLYRAAPKAELTPVPGWIVTNGWVCDYNTAIGYGFAEDGTAVGGDDNPSCAPDAFGRSEVKAADILTHHNEYGAYCRKLEKQVDALLNHTVFIEGQK
ncbi:hypothetical protein [Herminiimonas arsenitoxidans]|uniref:hypothetical protein n=1 Tax=Herminiimonas arsenitoxidans TaxID=1809410 RepID=UPI000970BE6D|nr:hypothetical protein [Herminiimonas arsenitoxidans]